MIRGEKEFLKVVIYLSWLLLTYLSIWDLFNNPYRSIIWVISLILMIWIHFKFKQVSDRTYMALVFILLMHVLGEVYTEWFYVFPNYDKVIHLINPILLSILLYSFLKPFLKDKKKRTLYTISIVISLSLFWEIFEFIMDKTFGGIMQGVNIRTDNHFFGATTELKPFMTRLKDTIIDLILSFLGSILFLLGFHIFNKKKK